jgi:hypothetical protein
MIHGGIKILTSPLLQSDDGPFHQDMHSTNLKLLLLQFSSADPRRLFNFSSGHVGALPIQGHKLTCLLRPESGMHQAFARKMLSKALGQTLLEAIAPLQHAKLLARTVLRKLRGRYSVHEIRALTVYSVGSNSPEQDAYIGKLLEQIEEPFDYITIAGGSLTKSQHSHLVETLLSPWQITCLCLSLPLQVPLQLYWLLVGVLRIKGTYERRIFLLFGLQEIVSGGVLSQQIAVQAMGRHFGEAKTHSLLFPMEGRNWEKCIVKSAKNAGIRSTGYLHCALTPRHLALLDNGFISPAERPNRMIAPSEMAHGLLTKAYGDIVRKGYFLRSPRKSEGGINRPQPSLLFALIGDAGESELIIRQVASLKNILQQQLVIRLNPNTASFLYLKQLTCSLGLLLYTPQAPALPQICFFRSSSVAIEYLKQDVRSIYLALDEPISNNIFELDNKFGIESVHVDDAFGDNICCLLRKPSPIKGDDIATYYLDENFTAQDLPKLIF